MKRYQLKPVILLFFAIIMTILQCTMAFGAEQAVKPVTITISGWISSSFEQAFLFSAIQQFQQRNPMIKVDYDPLLGVMGTAYMAELITKFEKGNGPDVFYVSSERSNQVVKQDLALPLDDLMAETGFSREDFLDELMKTFSHGGKTYGIPKDFNTFVLFYDIDAFKKAGIPLPDMSWDRKKLVEAAVKLTNLGNEGSGRKAGLCFERYNSFPLILFGLQNGVRFIDDRRAVLPLATPEMIEALEFYADLKCRSRCMAYPQELGANMPGEALGKGKAAMIVEGGYLIPYLDTAFPRLNYGTCILPSGQAGRKDLLMTVAYSISKESKHRKEAWKLIEFLTGKETQTNLLKKGFALPTRKSLLGNKSLSFHKAQKAIMDSRNDAVIQDFGIAGVKLLDLLSQAQDEVVTGRMTTVEALKKVDREINEWIKIVEK
ncbi:MAG: ABC transporter substrate-binding protein [Vulcanimicrobiota bacterium]